MNFGTNIANRGNKSAIFDKYCGNKSAIVKKHDTQLQSMYTKLVTATTAAHPDNVQGTFSADLMDMETDMTWGLDLGIMSNGYCNLSYNLQALDGPDMYQSAFAMTGNPNGKTYVVIPESATAGVIRLFVESDAVSSYQDIPYSDYDATAGTFKLDVTNIMMPLDDDTIVDVTPVTTPFVYYVEGAAGGDDEL